MAPKTRDVGALDKSNEKQETGVNDKIEDGISTWQTGILKSERCQVIA